MPKRTLVAGSLAAALAMGGCGSDSGFRNRAEAVCTAYDTRIESVARPTSAEELVRTAGEIADLLEAQLGELKALDPPESLANDYAAWLVLNEEAVENAQAIVAAARTDDRQRIGDLAAAAEQNEVRADRLARDMGIPECMILEEGLAESGTVTRENVVTVEGG
jgi:hypothetical protein